MCFRLLSFIVNSYVRITQQLTGFFRLIVPTSWRKMSWILFICLLNNDIPYVSHHLEYRKKMILKLWNDLVTLQGLVYFYFYKNTGRIMIQIIISIINHKDKNWGLALICSHTSCLWQSNDVNSMDYFIASKCIAAKTGCPGSMWDVGRSDHSKCLLFLTW